MHFASELLGQYLETHLGPALGVTLLPVLLEGGSIPASPSEQLTSHKTTLMLKQHIEGVFSSPSPSLIGFVLN